MYEITQHALTLALIGGVLGSIVCGIISVIILEKKLVLMSGGVAHISYGGIGLGLYAHFSPMLGAIVFSILGSLGVGHFSRRNSENGDVLVGLFWAVSMSLGVLLTQLSRMDIDFDHYLFGDIFSITPSFIWVIFGLAIVIIFIVFSLFHSIKAYLFDEEYALVQGVKIRALEMIIFILIGLTTIMLLKMVGLVMTVGLYAAPPAIAKKFSKDLKKVILLSILLTAIFVIIGVYIAYALQIATGAGIIFIAGIAYFVSIFIEYLTKRHRMVPKNVK